MMEDTEDIQGKVNQLLDQGRQNMVIGQLFSSAYELDKSKLDTVLALGEVNMELGDVDKARSLFKTCCDLYPESSHDVWMYYAQTLDGMDAVGCYLKGISIMEKQLSGKKSLELDYDNSSKFLDSQVISAYCSIVDIYMSDLCFEPDAESRCETYLKKALEYDTNDVNVLQTLANFRLSQNKQVEAKPLMIKVAASLQEMMNASTDDIQLISFEFRVCTARLLIELALFKEAISILDYLVQEDDTVLDVWILLSQCHFNCNHMEFTLECLQKAKEMVTSFLTASPNDEQFQFQLCKVEEGFKAVQKRMGT